MSEQLVVGLFVLIVFSTYLAGAAIVFARAAAHFGGRTRKTTAAVRWIERVVLTLCAAGAVCIGYGYFIEPHWLAITRFRVPNTRVVGGTSIRIAHISDFHCRQVPGLEERLPGVLQREKPDLILFTGDAINVPGAVPVFRSAMQRISTVAPTYGVQGNWDVGGFVSRANVFADTGMRLLDDDVAQLNVRGTKVWIAGSRPGDLSGIKDRLQTAPPDAVSIFLNHYADEIEDPALRGIDLYLAGHTHGGQVALPFYGALITLSATGKRYEAGRYTVGHTVLYVNRGIGTEGGVPPVRFYARPEVAFIDIVPASD